MVNALFEDETGQQTIFSPAKQLAQYFQDKWNISNPAVDDITWLSYWMPTAAITMAFKELRTSPFPMTVGWQKWEYHSHIGIILSAWYESNGDYSTLIQNARTHIEDLVHIDVTAMKDYGFSMMHIVNFSDVVDYPKDKSYKDSVCDLLIEIELLGSKTVVTL